MNLPKKDILILIGNVIDHFDTALYVFLAPIIASIFFPFEDQITGLILMLSVMTSSIFTRPFGAYIFGIIANNKGASTALSYSLIGLGVSTFLLGCTPSFEVVGYLAPILLIIFRILIGIFAAGENSISRLYIVENKNNQNALKGSFLYESSSILGIILASLMVTLIGYAPFENAWRICFIFGGFAALIGYFIRKQYISISEEKIEESLKIKHFGGLKLLWKHRSDITRIVMICSVTQLTYIIPFVTMNHIVPLISEINLKTMMAMNSFLLILDLFLIQLIGKLIININYKIIMMRSSLLLAASIIPIWYFITSSSLIIIFAIRIWIIILGILYMCPLNIWLSKQIEGRNKYIITGTASALSSCIFGKLMPILFMWSFHICSSYLIISCIAAIIFLGAYLILKKNPK